MASYLIYPRGILLLFGVSTTATGAVVAYKASNLIARYPPLDPQLHGSSFLRNPSSWPTDQATYTAYTDVYGARVPLSVFHKIVQQGDLSPRSLTLEWARIALRSKVLAIESKIVGCGRQGDLGQDNLIAGQKLLNGVFTVATVPRDRSTGRGFLLTSLNGSVSEGANLDENTLGVCWSVPFEAVQLFEKISRWGYPFRLMLGGRHEFTATLLSPTRADSEHEVLVRFSAAHDHLICDEEGSLEKQKRIPKWVQWSHRVFARWVLDEAVKEAVKQKADNS